MATHYVKPSKFDMVIGVIVMAIGLYFAKTIFDSVFVANSNLGIGYFIFDILVFMAGRDIYNGSRESGLKLAFASLSKLYKIIADKLG